MQKSKEVFIDKIMGELRNKYNISSKKDREILELLYRTNNPDEATQLAIGLIDYYKLKKAKPKFPFTPRL